MGFYRLWGAPSHSPRRKARRTSIARTPNARKRSSWQIRMVFPIAHPNPNLPVTSWRTWFAADLGLGRVSDAWCATEDQRVGFTHPAGCTWRLPAAPSRKVTRVALRRTWCAPASQSKRKECTMNGSSADSICRFRSWIRRNPKIALAVGVHRHAHADTSDGALQRPCRDAMVSTRRCPLPPIFITSSSCHWR